MIETDTRKVLERTYRPGRPLSRACLFALTLATREILFFVTEGHRAPVARSFDFGDDGKAVDRE